MTKQEFVRMLAEIAAEDSLANELDEYDRKLAECVRSLQARARRVLADLPASDRTPTEPAPAPTEPAGPPSGPSVIEADAEPEESP